MRREEGEEWVTRAVPFSRRALPVYRERKKDRRDRMPHASVPDGFVFTIISSSPHVQ
jgi:hypothetical protein